MTSIFFADRNRLFRESIKLYIENERFAVVSQHQSTLEDLVPEIEKKAPDIVITEYISASRNIASIKEIVNRFTATKFLVMAVSLTHTEFSQLIHLGVKGCILKDAGVYEILKAINEVMEGKIYFPSEVLHKVLSSQTTINGKNNSSLTEREQEILYLLCDGLSNEEISEKLYLSSDTIKWHRGNILVKCGCKNILSLYKYAIQNKYIVSGI